ncbi:MAG: hypothetical protein L6R36_004175 [Xanthoria steineri]|nr:MAG: hypothetical protein L6R36_004175 [Xanthoria steineri]
MRVCSTFWISLSSFVSGLLAAFCYHPNGDPVHDTNYVPCSLVAEGIASACCAINRHPYPDECLANGLCRNGGDFFRDSCTDPTWKSPSCPQLCTTGFGQSGSDVGRKEEQNLKPEYSQEDVALTDCRDGSYCCGSANVTCCSQGQGIRMNSTLNVPSQPVTSTATSSTSTLASAQSEKSTSTASNNNQSMGLDQKAVLGIALGCGIVGCIIVGSAIGYFVVRKRHKSSKYARKRLSSVVPVKPEYRIQHRDPIYELDTYDLPPPRVVFASRRQELAAGEIVPELSGNKRESLRRWTARLGHPRAWIF